MKQISTGFVQKKPSTKKTTSEEKIDSLKWLDGDASGHKCTPKSGATRASFCHEFFVQIRNSFEGLIREEDTECREFPETDTMAEATQSNSPACPLAREDMKEKLIIPSGKSVRRSTMASPTQMRRGAELFHLLVRLLRLPVARHRELHDVLFHRQAEVRQMRHEGGIVESVEAEGHVAEDLEIEAVAGFGLVTAGRRDDGRCLAAACAFLQAAG